MFLSLLKLQIFIKHFRYLIIHTHTRTRTHTHTHTHIKLFKHTKSRVDKNNMQDYSIWAQKDSAPQSTKILASVQRTLSPTYLEIFMHQQIILHAPWCITLEVPQSEWSQPQNMFSFLIPLTSTTEAWPFLITRIYFNSV